MKQLSRKDVDTSLINNLHALEEPELTKARIEIYRLFSQSVDNHHHREMTSTRFFLTIQLAIFSAVILLLKDGNDDNLILGLLFAFIGILFCFTWSLFENAMHHYASAGHQVLEEFEQHLPARPHCAYWFEYLNEGKDFATANVLRRSLATLFGFILLGLAIYCLVRIILI